jgi:hypothetical protein
MAKLSLGQACPTTDPMYPGGCPSGYTLQQAYFVSSGGYGAANAPGAVAVANPSVNNCPQSFVCLNPSYQTPGLVSDNTCMSKQKDVLIAMEAGAALGLLIAPDWWLLWLAGAAAAFFYSAIGCPGESD